MESHKIISKQKPEFYIITLTSGSTGFQLNVIHHTGKVQVYMSKTELFPSLASHDANLEFKENDQGGYSISVLTSNTDANTGMNYYIGVYTEDSAYYSLTYHNNLQKYTQLSLGMNYKESLSGTNHKQSTYKIYEVVVPDNYNLYERDIFINFLQIKGVVKVYAVDDILKITFEADTTKKITGYTFEDRTNNIFIPRNYKSTTNKLYIITEFRDPAATSPQLNIVSNFSYQLSVSTSDKLLNIDEGTTQYLTISPNNMQKVMFAIKENLNSDYLLSIVSQLQGRNFDFRGDFHDFSDSNVRYSFEDTNSVLLNFSPNDEVFENCKKTVCFFFAEIKNRSTANSRILLSGNQVDKFTILIPNHNQRNKIIKGEYKTFETKILKGEKGIISIDNPENIKVISKVFELSATESDYRAWIVRALKNDINKQIWNTDRDKHGDYFVTPETHPCLQDECKLLIMVDASYAINTSINYLLSYTNKATNIELNNQSYLNLLKNKMCKTSYYF